MSCLRIVASLVVALSMIVSVAMGADGRSGEAAGSEAGTPAVPTGGGDSRTFGIASTVAHTIGAYAFTTSSSVATWAAFVGTGDRYLSNTGGQFLAAVELPAGAQVLSMEVQGCDFSPSAGLLVRFFSNTTTGGVQSETQHGSLNTGVPSVGCGFFAADLPSPITVDNQHRTYYIQVEHGTVTDGTIRFSAVRLFYRLQVSPAPAVATFGDVPTGHPFFTFVEALAAAGITGGCSNAPPLYCPDNPVTRGQMAVFFSRALGLHWAP